MTPIAADLASRNGVSGSPARRRRHVGGDAARAVKTKSLGETHLFSASELSLTIRISRAEFFALKPRVEGRANRGYGSIPLFNPKTQPAALQEKLHALRKRFRATPKFEEIVRKSLQHVRREHFAGLFDQALAPRWKAQATMRALNRYFRAADCGWPQWKAAREASAEFIRLTGCTIGERQIRRLAQRVDQLGGPELAPIDAYRDFRSVPHKRTVRPSANKSAPQGGSSHG